MIPLHDDDPLEEKFRWILRLPPGSPDPRPAVWEDGSVRFLQPEESQEERRRWIEEDVRADVARWGARLCRPLGGRGWVSQLFQNAFEPFRDLQKRHQLSQTPYLVFVPKDQSEEWVLEGDLLFEGGSIPMIFVAAEGLADHVQTESGGSLDYLFCEENDLLFEDRWIVLPGPLVQEEAVCGALRSWYREIFKNNRRHSTQRGILPRISVA